MLEKVALRESDQENLELTAYVNRILKDKKQELSEEMGKDLR